MISSRSNCLSCLCHLRNADNALTDIKDAQIIQALRRFDTATICNVVATQPKSDICLKLYDAWDGEYYTDQTLRCMYPNLGPICGYAATAWYSEASENYTELDQWSLPDHLEATKKPTILVARQTYPPGLTNRSGLFGGNMTAEFKAQGVVGVVTDGPMRDYEEIRQQEIQYLTTGLTSGHGNLMLRGVDIPVKVAGMTVSSGTIVHMDVCGAVKFPADKLARVLENATELLKREAEYQSIFRDPSFSLKKWKEIARQRNSEVRKEIK
jgi:4-hydroxy-4-methyl-2-oxoglutarate aldolase